MASAPERMMSPWVFRLLQLGWFRPSRRGVWARSWDSSFTRESATSQAVENFLNTMSLLEAWVLVALRELWSRKARVAAAGSAE